MTEERVLVVSADGHAGAPKMADYLPYFEPSERAQVADLLADEERLYNQVQAPDFAGRRAKREVDDHARLWAPGAPERFGGWDPGLRLAQLDTEGIAAEVLVPGHQFSSLPLFSVANRPFDANLRDAGGRAYHRWLADFMTAGDGRLFGMADPGSCHDIDAAVRELRWAREHGFVSVGVPGIIADAALPSLFTDYYEPFWRACAELDMTLMVHAGWGFPQGKYQEFIAAFVTTHLGSGAAADILAAQQRLDGDARAALAKELAESPASPLRLDFGPRRLLWQLMLAGVFDRYPTLRFVLTEVRSDWLPATLALLDSWAAENATPLTMLPSEYFARHCLATPSSIHRTEVEHRDEVGVGHLMFGADYPHPEGTWPDTRDWIRVAFAGVPEEELRQILGENAIRAFALDRAPLAAVAARVGPTVAELHTGAEDVPGPYIEQFHRRAGFLRPAERVDEAAVRELAEADLRLATR